MGPPETIDSQSQVKTKIYLPCFILCDSKGKFYVIFLHDEFVVLKIISLTKKRVTTDHGRPPNAERINKKVISCLDFF